MEEEDIEVGGSSSDLKWIENESSMMHNCLALIFASFCTNAYGFEIFGGWFKFLWLRRVKIYTPTNKLVGKLCVDVNARDKRVCLRGNFKRCEEKIVHFI